MSILRTAPEPAALLRFLPDPPVRFPRSGAWPRALGCAALSATLALAPAPGLAQPTRPAAAAEAEEALILTVRANGVERGLFTLLRQPDGDFWVAEADFPRLNVQPLPQARRQAGGAAYYSVRALSGTALQLNEAELSLAVNFPAQELVGSQIDLSNRPPAVAPEPPGRSLILSYRLATRSQGGVLPRQFVANTQLDLRFGGLLLRQETQLDTASPGRHLARGRSQALYDDIARARRYLAGDTISNAGAYGSTITGAGLQLLKLYDLTPDLITQPTASFRASSALPAEVEVAVDGAVLSRTSVGPGPININNLLLNGGTRNVRITVVDASGRREVIEQPFLFTESVLAAGLHEYGYFLGKRSELAPDGHWRYLEPAWQGFHRYGVNDNLTVSGGGEGNADFTNAGAGLTLRSDRLGLFSADLLGSHDRRGGSTARGWAARYTYFSPAWAMLLGRRQFEQGFRTFTTSAELPFPRRETTIGLSTRIYGATVSADFVRTEDERDVRDTRIARISHQLTPRTLLGAEYQTTRINGQDGWSASIFLRTQLDGPYWVSATARAASGNHGLDLETGKTLEPGEGFGYRVGTTTVVAPGSASTLALASANWNLRSTSFEASTSAPLHGDGTSFTEVAMAGAVVGVDGAFGFTRQVSDSFVLARVGVPLPGIDVFLNSQLQGKTDADGKLFLPDVGSFGRQDVSLNDRQVPLQYNLQRRQRTVLPVFRSGTAVDFGGARVRAVAGTAWQLTGGQRVAIGGRSWSLRGPAGTLQIETGRAGDFYLENVEPGHYAGALDVGDRALACRVDIPDFPEAVRELEEGIRCE
ncbi:fimbria/pilus outer membrane usher protein [Ramlibacter alkalitolerans]|uniref:Fimbrial biogenesis outer membrane usher protein n=1 Tax=Ramlibacter alkalitolerans TaxID=2039631 RepID=A0ABS1JSW6_9BURK|nr:fimbria/pilus outer membrane usher protein [Ramlibacter alkalitolerans]MBL0427375.1 fimbrial biogenesis outer membrane usher protein [Ramlibacter alkalitolerans]